MQKSTKTKIAENAQRNNYRFYGGKTRLINFYIVFKHNVKYNINRQVEKMIACSMFTASSLNKRFTKILME